MIISADHDVKEFQTKITNINGSMNKLAWEMTNIVESVDSIKMTMEESTIAINSVAEKTSDVVKIMKDATEISEENNTHAEKMNEILSKIKM